MNILRTCIDETCINKQVPPTTIVPPSTRRGFPLQTTHFLETTSKNIPQHKKNHAQSHHPLAPYMDHPLGHPTTSDHHKHQHTTNPMTTINNPTMDQRTCNHRKDYQNQSPSNHYQTIKHQLYYVKKHHYIQTTTQHQTQNHTQ
jgi:hypothetical protein